MNQTALTMTSQVVRTDEILTASVGDELVMMSIAKGSYFGLDPVGSHVWERLEQPAVVEELCDGLLSNFDVGPEECREDLLQFLGELLEQGLIEVLPVPEST